MGKEMWMFGDTRIKKNTFCRDKSPTLQKAYILRKYYYLTRFILVKKNYEYFIGYLYNDHKIKQLHIMLPKRSAYVKSYDGKN